MSNISKVSSVTCINHMELHVEIRTSLISGGTPIKRSSKFFFSIIAVDIRPVIRAFPIPAGVHWHLQRYHIYHRQCLRHRIILAWNTRRYLNLVLILCRTHRYCAIVVKIVRTQPSSKNRPHSLFLITPTKDNNFY